MMSKKPAAVSELSADMSAILTPDGGYLYVSSACERLFGWTSEELVGHNRMEFVHPDDGVLVSALSPGDGGSPTIATYRFRCADATYRWTETASRRADPPQDGLVVDSVRDISERRASDALLEHRASTDPLTGVANRTVFTDRLHHALRRQDRGNGVVAVLLLDLDRFKVINDSLGHVAGDRVLIAMAERLLPFLRASDTVARLGGDEFAVVAEDVVDETAAVALGERIAKAGREPFRIGTEDFVCTVSVGIATTADARYGAERLLQEADLALYRAKDRGRDRAEVFDENLRTTAVGRLRTERMLRQALSEGRLRVHYQPILDVSDRAVVGAEALVRIVDDGGALLEPASFIEVADETGLLAKMDEDVFADAVRQASQWFLRFPHSRFSGVAVNVTARHLSESTFARQVIDALDAAGLPRRYLQIEVTERVLMEASRSTMTGLRALRDAGVQVGLDDFGSGFSSLAYLRHFPLDFIKVDQSVVREIGAADAEQAILASIIQLGHALNLTVVAEGIESEQQLDALTSIGCDRVQGFLFARPAEPGAIDDLLTNDLGQAARRPVRTSPIA